MWQIRADLDSCESGDFMCEKQIHDILDSNPAKALNPSTKMITQPSISSRRLVFTSSNSKIERSLSTKFNAFKVPKNHLKTIFCSIGGIVFENMIMARANQVLNLQKRI